MKAGRISIAVALVMALLFISKVSADVPMLLNYQGRLTDPGGTAQSGTFTMSFAVYDAETGGNQLPSGTPWNETLSVQVTNGVFNVLLGSMTAIPTNLFAGGPSDPAGPLRFLQVTVNGETLAPRRRIVSAAFAMHSGVSQVDTGSGLQGGPITESGTVSVSAPTCTGTDKLVWTGSAFQCAPDVGSSGSPLTCTVRSTPSGQTHNQICNANGEFCIQGEHGGGESMSCGTVNPGFGDWRATCCKAS